MSNSHDHVPLLNSSIRRFFSNALKISLQDPSRIGFILKTILRQRKAARTRVHWERNGVHVPPFIIASITKRCNLKCNGCYSHVLHQTPGNEMPLEDLRQILEQAGELGVSFVLLAGGEPLLRADILDVTLRFPEIIFPLFTNGTLLSGKILDKLQPQKHVIPILSMEGWERETDERRGRGVFRNSLKAMQKLRDLNIFFGISLTVTRDNLDLVTGDSFIEEFMNVGCRLFFFVEYIPVQEGTEELVISQVQREALESSMERLKSKFPGLFISFPGDEKMYGGCLAAGRGFIHISADGRVEPCPFAPYSDTNLKAASLKEALKSEFLETIRNSDEHLHEEEGGCALWNKRDWVRSLIKTSH